MLHNIIGIDFLEINFNSGQHFPIYSNIIFVMGGCSFDGKFSAPLWPILNQVEQDSLDPPYLNLFYTIGNIQQKIGGKNTERQDWIILSG